MSVTEKYLNKTRKQVVVPAFSTVTVEYNDSMPNYYRVTNMGDSRLYCGTSSMPTVKRHEFTVGAHKIKLYAEPSRRNNLYIYNPSGSDVECIIFSFEAEFDPATLALADLEIDLSGQTVESRAVITAFEAELPKGSNKIGSVDIEGENANTIITRLGVMATSLANLLKNSVVSGITNLHTLYERLVSIDGKIATETTLASVKTAITEVKTAVQNQSGAAGYRYEVKETASDGESASFADADMVGLCTNDSESANTVISWTDANGVNAAFNLKPGETVADFKFSGPCAVTVSGGKYRVIIGYKE